LGSSGGGATFDTAGYIVTLSGSLSGAGSLTKVDSGTLILSGTDSYTGGTTVSEGTLILTNNEAIADGTSLTVGAGAMSIFAGAAAPQTAASASAVPEPGTLMLLGAGAIGLLGYAWRR
ncbi:MAG: autotransporter-associated beta strand repeat-containing protein, partial [Thermoguttaceae bacterium]